jgi:hypothetical protein
MSESGDLFNDQSDVQTKVGHVAKFNENEDNILLDQLVTEKQDNQFIGLTKEVFFSYFFYLI